jgi:hypothetical protein
MAAVWCARSMPTNGDGLKAVGRLSLGSRLASSSVRFERCKQPWNRSCVIGKTMRSSPGLGFGAALLFRSPLGRQRAGRSEALDLLVGQMLDADKGVVRGAGAD